MAMIKCKECGAEISSQAKSCPKCGAPPPKGTSLFTWIVAIVLIPSCVVGIYQSQSTNDNARAKVAAKTPAEREADARKEAEFQRLVLVAKTVKSSLKNPPSFELTDAILTDAGDFCMTYRATNSFNAPVPGYAVLTSDNKTAMGNAEVVRGLWNKHCASKSGKDMLHIRHAL